MLTRRDGFFWTDDRALDRALAPRRPWWFWVAFVAYLGIAALELWVVYRTAAGHPVLGGLNFAG